MLIPLGPQRIEPLIDIARVLSTGIALILHGGGGGLALILGLVDRGLQLLSVELSSAARSFGAPPAENILSCLDARRGDLAELLGQWFH